MELISDVVNTLGLSFTIIGALILLTGVKRLELESGPFHSDTYVDTKTGSPPKVLTLPDDMRTKISVIIVILGLGLQIVSIWIS